jgi:beta-glucosidase-like glycosyl hydrolase
MQGGECLHSAGVDTYQDNHGFRATNFPTPIAIGASWDKDLAHQVAAAVATEARAKANIALGRGQYGWNLGSLCYAPVVNLYGAGRIQTATLRSSLDARSTVDSR